MYNIAPLHCVHPLSCTQEMKSYHSCLDKPTCSGNKPCQYLCFFLNIEATIKQEYINKSLTYQGLSLGRLKNVSLTFYRGVSINYRHSACHTQLKSILLLILFSCNNSFDGSKESPN